MAKFKVCERGPKCSSGERKVFFVRSFSFVKHQFIFAVLMSNFPRIKKCKMSLSSLTWDFMWPWDCDEVSRTVIFFFFHSNKWTSLWTVFMMFLLRISKKKTSILLYYFEAFELCLLSHNSHKLIKWKIRPFKINL